MKDRHRYKTITGLNGRAFIFAFIISTTAALMGHLLIANYLGDAVIFFSVLFISYTWFPRKCPKCMKKMNRDTSNGLLPEGYYCKTDLVYCPTYVNNEV